ncbi:hypothetical protein LKE08_14890 [Lyngbya sp. CCY1209]|jgi:hypothetical protein|nr:hypothetical protein [Lyngbya sp. CCY1209]MEB3884716.1 hypothetical protein [Lyngbya sp. CCY1209]
MISEAALTSPNGLPVHPLCPIAIAAILTGFILAIIVAVKEGLDRLKKLHQIPCSRCAFFTGDYRLKCTIHPCKALSEEAIGCLDYEAIAPCRRRTDFPVQPSPQWQLLPIARKRSRSGV